jgi:serine/threonine protein kinase
MTGRSVLHYQFLEKLGAGGMGEVYKAQDTRLNRFVAIKLLPAAKSDPERRRRFAQEAQAASALNHPNIITIHDIVSDSDSDSEYMVIEYIEGKTLIDVIPNGGLRVPQALQYAIQIADALTAAHIAGIIHRDLKPGNVMVTGSGRVKILDFGLAKVTDAGPISHTDETVSMAGNGALTVEGSIIGTLSYMSPEQAQGKRVDLRSDIFSFGSLMYEMVTGRRAFHGDSGISTLTAVLRDETKPISEVAPDVPAALEEIINRCLRKDPEERWQSMSEVQAELTALKRQSDSGVLYKSQILPPPVKPSSSKTPAAIAVAIGIALAGAGGWWWTSHRSAPPAEVPPVAVSAAPAVASPVIAPPPLHGDGVLTNDSILEMVQAKVPVPVILTHLRASKTGFDLSTAEVIRLTKAGVPESVIEAMHDPKRIPAQPAARTSTTAKTTPAATPAPAIPAASTPAIPTPTPSTSASATPAPAPAAPASKPTATPAVSVKVSDALPLRITLADDLPADAEEGRALRFTVTDGLRVGDAAVIAKGATVTGEVAEVAKKRFLGKGNRMTFRLLKAESVDNQKLNVRAMPTRRGDSPVNRPVDSGKGIRSKELSATKGTEYLAYIDGEQTVSIRK